MTTREGWWANYETGDMVCIGVHGDHERFMREDDSATELGGSRRGLTRAVRLAGFLAPPELEASYRTADLFALPCREEAGGDTEGFGLVFLEAGARGLPVIGGRTAGVVEAVRDGETGLLVDGEDPAAIAAACASLLQDRERAAALGRAGRARVEAEHLPEHYARRVLEAGP